MEISLIQRLIAAGIEGVVLSIGVYLLYKVFILIIEKGAK